MGSKLYRHVFVMRLSDSLILKVERALNVLIRDKFHVPGAIKIQSKHIMLRFPHDKHNILIIVIFVLHLFKSELWKHRNGVKFENGRLSENRLFHYENTPIQIY